MDNINQLKKTIAALSQNPDEAETVKALKRQLKDAEDKACKFMVDTGKPRFENHPCKGNAIKCSHPDLDRETKNRLSEIMTTRKCNAMSCKYFTAGSDGRQSGTSDASVSVRDNPCPYDPL
ncbi:MAG: hypothetical protein PHV82_14120 [Victivallaceae bacterium]|nr:hypothetical protein [Victivallaceae bacterium]